MEKNEKKCFIFWSQNKQQKSERQTKNNSPAVDACFCLIVIHINELSTTLFWRLLFKECVSQDKKSFNWSEVNNYKTRFIFIVRALKLRCQSMVILQTATDSKGQLWLKHLRFNELNPASSLVDNIIKAISGNKPQSQVFFAFTRNLN